MSVYTPDEWVMLKIVSKEWGTLYKVFAGWQGGYTSGDSWKLSSGTVSAILVNTKKLSGVVPRFHFLQATGSTYVVHRDANGHVGGWRANVLNSLIEQIKALGATVEIMPSDTDFTTIDYTMAGLDVAAN